MCKGRGGAPKGPKTIKDKQADLNKRRIGKAANALAKVLETGNLLPVDGEGEPEDLYQIVDATIQTKAQDMCNVLPAWLAVFGMDTSATVHHGTELLATGEFAHGASPWKELAIAETMELHELDYILFRSFCRILSLRINNAHEPSTQEKECKLICKLLGLDWAKEFRKPVVAMMPEPKSWAAEKLQAKKTTMKKKSSKKPKCFGGPEEGCTKTVEEECPHTMECEKAFEQSQAKKKPAKKKAASTKKSSNKPKCFGQGDDKCPEGMEAQECDHLDDCIRVSDPKWAAKFIDKKEATKEHVKDE